MLLYKAVVTEGIVYYSITMQFTQVRFTKVYFSKCAALFKNSASNKFT